MKKYLNGQLLHMFVSHAVRSFKIVEDNLARSLTFEQAGRFMKSTGI